MFGWSTWWFQQTASGLLDALWGEVWHWGLGIGVIILCILGAFLSPVGKQMFTGAAFATFILLVVYGMGIKNEKAICDARVKVIYLKAHPKLNSRNLAKNWRVSPTWDPSAPPRYTPIPPQRNCYGIGWGCS